MLLVLFERKEQHKEVIKLSQNSQVIKLIQVLKILTSTTITTQITLLAAITGITSTIVQDILKEKVDLFQYHMFLLPKKKVLFFQFTRKI